MDSEKNKKFFSIAAPTMNLRKKGEGVSSQNVASIYSAVNVPILPYVCAHKSTFI